MSGSTDLADPWDSDDSRLLEAVGEVRLWHIQRTQGRCGCGTCERWARAKAAARAGTQPTPTLFDTER